MSIEFPPEVIGHMAGITGTNDNMVACNSCQRAVVYGVLAHLSSALPCLMEGDTFTAAGHISYATQVLLELVKVDMAGAAPETDALDDEAWRVAMLGFVQSRIDHYTDAATGEIIFEPHNEHGEPEGIAA